MTHLKTYKSISSSDFIGKSYLIPNTALRTIDWSKQFSLLDGIPASNSRANVSVGHSSVENREFIFYVDELLSRDECHSVFENGRVTEAQHVSFSKLRNNSRLIVFEKDFARYGRNSQLL